MNLEDLSGKYLCLYIIMTPTPTAQSPTDVEFLGRGSDAHDDDDELEPEEVSLRCRRVSIFSLTLL